MSAGPPPAPSAAPEDPRPRRNRRRAEWAARLTRPEPSENWDDDFFFGSGSLSPPAHSRPPSTSRTTTASLAHPALASRPPSRPPSSAPPSRGTSSEGHPPALRVDPRGLAIHSSSSSVSLSRSSNAFPPNLSRSRPPVSLARRASTLHKAVSSQDSVPSVSDISSLGLRSPSSSLSTTDDSRADTSRSSGDYSLRFRRTCSRGNQSFNTETDFTEPDTELDWGDDTDLDNTSSCSLLVPAPRRRPLVPIVAAHPLPPPTSSTSPPGTISSLLSQSASLHRAHCSASDTSMPSLPATTNPHFGVAAPGGLTHRSVLDRRHHHSRSTHSSFDSQSTFTSESKSKSTSPLFFSSHPPASSSSSSLGYHSNHHHSSIPPAALSASSTARPTPLPTPQCLHNKVSHSQPIGCGDGDDVDVDDDDDNDDDFYKGTSQHYRSGSDSYDAAPSSTETDAQDGLSDHLPNPLYQSSRSHHHLSNSPSTLCHHPFASARGTPTANQRSRKQALCSRPSQIHPSLSVSSLATSISSLTPVKSHAHHTPSLTHHQQSDEDRLGRTALMRKKIKKRRPSMLPLNAHPPTPSSDSSSLSKRSIHSVLARVAANPPGSIYSHSPQPGGGGDLAFAVDSDDDLHSRRRYAERRDSSAFEIMEKPQFNHDNNHTRLQASAPPLVCGFPHRQMSIRTPLTLSRVSLASKVTTAHPPLTPDSGTSNPSLLHEDKPVVTRRPLSFTALFSRTSLSSSYSRSCVPADASALAGASSIVTDPTSVQRPRSSRVRPSHRQTASIGSVCAIYQQPPDPSPPPFSISQGSHESFMSRIRRLSSRPTTATPHATTVPNSPKRKRLSPLGNSAVAAPRTSFIGAARPNPDSKLHVPPSPPARPPTAPAASYPIIPSNLGQPRRAVSQSQSVASDFSLKSFGRNTFCPSSQPSHLSSKLHHQFSLKATHKAAVKKPSLTLLPTASQVDHQLLALSSCQCPPASFVGFSASRPLSSKSPKSNPGLRRKAAQPISSIEASWVADPYPARLLYSPSGCRDSNNSHLLSPPSHTQSFHHGPHVAVDRGWQHSHPSCSEPMPELTDYNSTTGSHFTPAHPHLHHQIHSTVMGSGTVPLARSNSMGELRIPSRITSQQGRLQTELNQMKEFARGIDELKKMRRTYRKALRSTRHTYQPRASDAHVALGNEHESDGNSTDSGGGLDATDKLPLTPPFQAGGIVPGQISPKTLSKLYSNFRRVQEEYKEWWTCCNVLIDLAEGTVDPRSKFSPERIRAISCYPTTGLLQSKPSTCASPPPPLIPKLPMDADDLSASPGDGGHHRKNHFDILKSVFGPTDPDSNGSVEGPPSLGDLPFCCATTGGDGDSQSLHHRITPPPSAPLTNSQASPAQPCSYLSNSLGDLTASTAGPPLSVVNSPGDVTFVKALTGLETQGPSQGDKFHQHITQWVNDEDDCPVVDLATARVHAGEDDVKVIPTLPVSQPVRSEGMASSTPRRLPQSSIRAVTSAKLNARQFSCHQQAQGMVNLGTVVSRGRLAAGGRMGIRPIKDFLKLLKARVNAEEKWSSRVKVVSPITPLDFHKRRAVSSPVGQEGSTGVSEPNKGVARSPACEDNIQGAVPRSAKSVGDQAGSVNVENGLTGGTQSLSAESSEEECWDDMFGLQDTSRTDSLDLALPGAPGSQSNRGRKKLAVGEGRLAMSSERMPQLLNYLSIVKERCLECLNELKSQTV